MNTRDFKRLKRISEERGGSEKKVKVFNAAAEEKRLYDSRHVRICNSLPIGRTVLVRDGVVLC